MTNANDFRNYYPVSTSAAVEAFNLQRSSAAPEIDPKSGKDLSVRQHTRKKSRDEIKAEQKAAFSRMAIAVATAVISVGMISAVLSTYVQKNELTKQISSIRSEITMAESDNISLNAQLESMASISQVEDYAVNNLGMVKLQTSQIVYIDTSEFIFLREANSPDTTISSSK